MAKHGYKCTCGWQLNRGQLTRHEYADKKIKHAQTCEALAKELEISRRAASK